MSAPTFCRLVRGVLRFQKHVWAFSFWFRFLSDIIIVCGGLKIFETQNVRRVLILNDPLGSDMAKLHTMTTRISGKTPAPFQENHCCRASDEFDCTLQGLYSIHDFEENFSDSLPEICAYNVTLRINATIARILQIQPRLIISH